MQFVVKEHPLRKRATSGGESMRRRTESSRPQPRGKRAVDASVEDLGGSLAEYASVEEVKSDLDRLRAEDDEILHPGSRKPASIAKRQTRRKLSDFAGILSPEAVQELRKAIDEARKERERLDRERPKRLLEAFDRCDDAAVLETARRKAKSAGLTRKKPRGLPDQVKKEVWNRTYGDKKRGK